MLPILEHCLPYLPLHNSRICTQTLQKRWPSRDFRVYIWKPPAGPYRWNVSACTFLHVRSLISMIRNRPNDIHTHWESYRFEVLHFCKCLLLSFRYTDQRHPIFFLLLRTLILPLPCNAVSHPDPAGGGVNAYGVSYANLLSAAGWTNMRLLTLQWFVQFCFPFGNSHTFIFQLPGA